MKAEIAPRITTEGRTPLQTVIPLSTPYLVFLDPSNICNARCQWCPTGSGEAKKFRKSQLMDFSLYRMIIDDLAVMPERIKVLRLYKDGEPLLNPDFCDMVAYAKNTGRFGQIDTTTNGLLLTPHLSDDIVSADLDKIFISVPAGYTKEYVHNVAYLYSISSDMTVLVKTIGDVIDSDQKDRFMQDFGNISDQIFIEYLAPCWPEFSVAGVGSKGIYGQSIHEVQICPYIFYSTAINSDGTVSLCFLDWKHNMIIGDLKKDKFKDIWNGGRLRFEQRLHLQKLRKSKEVSIESCKSCGQLLYGAPDDIDQYADEILGRLPWSALEL